MQCFIFNIFSSKCLSRFMRYSVWSLSSGSTPTGVQYRISFFISSGSSFGWILAIFSRSRNSLASWSVNFDHKWRRLFQKRATSTTKLYLHVLITNVKSHVANKKQTQTDIITYTNVKQNMIRYIHYSLYECYYIIWHPFANETMFYLK